MKIVIPTDGKRGLSEKVARHFGRSFTYTFLDESSKVIEVIDNTSEHMGGQGLPPELMKKHGATVLLCHDLGPRALSLCLELGIDVYNGQAVTVEDICDKWKRGELKKVGAGDVCEQHKV